MPYKENGKWRAAIMVNSERHTSLHDTKKAAREWEVAERKRLKSGKPTQQSMALNIFCSKYLDYAKLRMSEKVYIEKKAACKKICAELGKDTPVIQTIFNPLSLAKKLVGDEDLFIHLREHPNKLHKGMNILVESCQAFVRAVVKETGVDGIFCRDEIS